MTTFRPNAAFREQMEHDPEFVLGVAKIAGGLAAEVRNLAPRNSGYFVRSIESEGSTVFTTDHAAAVIEFGSINNPAYAPFRGAVIASGLRYEDHPS